MTAKLGFCLKAIKTLDDGDLSQLTDAIEGYMTAGMDAAQAEAAAVNDILAALASERTDLVGLLREQHADLFSLLTNPTAKGLLAKQAAADKAAAADRAEQKRLADKAKADAEVGGFTLTGSDRAADAAGQGSLFQPYQPYKTDLFGTPLPGADLFGTPEAGTTPAAKPTPAQASLVPEAPATGTTPDAPPGTYATRTHSVVTRQQQLGHVGPVLTSEQAANALSYLSKSSVERFDALVTDRRGNPLAVVGGFKGALTQTSVYPSTLTGEVFQIPGAANVWMVHNHPSGRSELSEADKRLEAHIADVFAGTSVKIKGIIAVTPKEWTAYDRGEDRMVTYRIQAAANGPSVPAQERQTAVDGKLGPPITSTSTAKRETQQMVFDNGGRSGLILLDAQLQPVAFVPWSAADAMPLKNNGKLDALYRAVHLANASSAIVATSNTMTPNQARNLGKALSLQDVRVVDIIDANGKSAAEQGMPMENSVLADFSGDTSERIPVAHAIEAGPVHEGNERELQKVQDAYRSHVPALKALKLTALPEVTRPDSEDPAATKERYAAQELGRLFGVRVGYFAANMQQFAEGLAPQGKDRVIFINEATSRPVMALLGHELTHSMRVSHPGLYAKLEERLRSVIENPEAHDKWLKALYRSRGIPALSDSKIREELIADIVGDAFTDPKTLRQLLRAVAKDQPSLFQRVLAAIRDFLDGVLAKLKNERPYATGRYLKDVEAARDMVVDVMAQFAGAQAAKSAPQAQPVNARELALASPNTEPFFSELTRQVEVATMKSAPASGWLEWLKGIQSKGVKADEIAWTGIEDWLKLQTGKVTRDQVLDYLKANGVQVTETRLGSSNVSQELRDAALTIDDALPANATEWMEVAEHLEQWAQRAQREGNKDQAQHYFRLAEEANQAAEDLETDSGNTVGATKYSKYTLPGGTNYQELLLTLPRKEVGFPSSESDYLRAYRARFPKSDVPDAEVSSFYAKRVPIPPEGKTVVVGQKEPIKYQSGHWNEPNVLAHVRFNERTDADGKRVLFIEEIQSDWAQEGKKRGFQKPDQGAEGWTAKLWSQNNAVYEVSDASGQFVSNVTRSDITEAGGEFNESSAVAEAYRRYREQPMRTARATRGEVPPAPFVGKTDAWVGLAVKRMVKYAVDHDFDRVAFVNGDQSAERYDLSKQISKIRFDGGSSGGIGRGNPDSVKGILYAYNTDGNLVMDKHVDGAEEIADNVGKEIAERLLNAEGQHTRSSGGTGVVRRELSGLDLKVGGEGMKAFYDKIVPKVVKEVTKKLGGEGITRVRIPNPDDVKPAYQVEQSGRGDWVAYNPFDRHDFHEFNTEAAAREFAAPKTLSADQLGFDITPKMREAAGGGLPMFSLAPQVLPPREGLARAFQRKFQDSFNRFTTVRNWAEKRGVRMGRDSNVWAYEERMHGRIATRVEDFREKRVRPAIQAIQKAGFGMAQVAEFLHAQHAEERNKQIETIDPKNKEGAGMSTADAQAILAKADPKLAALANDFRKITDETRDLLLKAGIISQEIVDAWQGAYKHYVPLKGGDDEKAAQTGTGKGLNVAGKQKRALGHAEREEHIVENIMRDHERAIALAEKNRVGHSLLSFITDLANEDVATIGQPEKRKVLKQSTQYEVREGNGARIGIFDSLNGAKGFINYSRQNGLLNGFGSPLIIVPVKGDPSVAYMASPQLAENEVNVYVQGHTVRVQLNDELLARAYTRSGVERLNQLMAINREINTFLSKAYTGYNPEFFFTNVIRDFTTGLINTTGNFGSKVTARAVANYPKAFATLIRYSVTGKETPAIKAYRDAGGSTGAAYLSDIERIGNDIQAAYDEYRGVMATFKARGTVAAGRAAARKLAGSVLSILQHLNSAGESAMRLSVFESVRTAPGYSEDDAASAAKNSTVNFNRRGEWGPVMGALYLFFNPGIQGTAAIMDTLVHGKHKQQAWALAAALPALAYMLAAGQFGGGDDDDETWMGIPDSTKDKNLIIRTGPKSYITIPVPYGYGFLYSLGNALHALRRGKDVDKVSLNVASNLLEHFSPVGNPLGDKLDTRGLAELVPGAVGGELMRDAVRLAVNRSGLGGDIVPDSPFDTGKPDNLRMFRSTKGSIYEKVAKAANRVTGGTDSLPGAVDVSPETLKFWVRAITGGSGAFLSDSATLGANAIRYAANPNDPDRAALKPEKNELPIVRRFLKDETINDRRRLFWEAVKEVDAAKADLQRARKLDDEVGEQKVQDERAELLAMGSFTKATTAAVKAQRDAVEEVMADTSTTLAFKRARVKELEEEERVLYNDYVREFSSARKEAKAQRIKETATP